jgi:hypothetical protein
MAAQSSFLLRSENIQSIARFAVMKPLLTYGALLDGPHCDLGPRSKVEFGRDVLDVISGGLFADDERLCDVAIGQAFGDQLGYLPLAG